MKTLIRIAACVGMVAGLTSMMTSVSTARPVMAAEFDPDTDAKALIKVDEDWSKAAGKKDLEKVTALYAEDAIGYPPNEPMAVGQAAVKKVWASFMADANFSISWKPVHVEVAKSGELGYTTGTYQDTFTGPYGKKTDEKGKYVCIWKKQKDGSWKAIHDTWNSDTK